MDRRITPATERVALNRLRGLLERPQWTDGTPARIAAPLAELRAAPDGPRDRQLAFGADVTVIDAQGEHAFVQATADGYCGWVAAQDLTPDLPPLTHHVSAPATHLYPGPDFKLRELAALPINAGLSVAAIEGQFARLVQGGFVPLQHISDRPAADPAAVALSLMGTPYLWGGNSRAGIDCSGLVQAALRACAVACPGDADLQEAAFAPVETIRRGDLLFWKGHVAMAINQTQIVHATAFAMAVIVEDIAHAIARIDAAGDGPFRGARRP
ncbi:MAG: NlpC/P60 family protein [Paracoccus sp. (in: a-proteobacteria)]|nr:NlpC/P60 family protein [Paracoccus sp. (in: a-proteobacteria)]